MLQIAIVILIATGKNNKTHTVKSNEMEKKRTNYRNEQFDGF